MNSKKVRVIAFYLPQFHPIQQNDLWWGKGFTEWTNVGKAKPLFKGHYQPRVPADLGYYDLRLPEVRKAQADMAREAGIEGFIYWHYWFGDGNRIMERIFDEVLRSKEPNFPFCLGWANHSWYAKEWNSDGIKQNRLLVEQKYLGEEDFRKHFELVLEAFRDDRYIKVESRPVFLIFDIINLPEDFIPLWNRWAKEAGFKEGIYFVAHVNKIQVKSKEELMLKGFSSVTYQKMSELYSVKSKGGKLKFRFFGLLNKLIYNKPVFSMNYKKAYPLFVGDEEKEEDVIPFMLPNWDHTPRSGINGTLLYNSTPELFRNHVKQVLDVVKEKENKLVFLKSWNEWAEGNYMEPDLVYGHGYLNALREELENFYLLEDK